MTFISVLMIGIGVVIAASPAQSQKRAAQADQYEITSKISEAMRSLSVDPGHALTILRRLDQKFPANDRILSRIGYTLQVMSVPDSAEVYFRRSLAVNPQNVESGRWLGGLLMARERNREAMSVFASLLEATGHNMSAYRAVGNTLRDLGKFEAALEIFESGRARGERHFVLTLEIAALHKQMGNYREAMSEYLIYIGDKGRNYRYTRGKILELLNGEPAERNALVSDLNARLETSPGMRFFIYDILSAHYLEEGRLEKALEMALLADAARASDGDVLLLLAEQILVVAELQPHAEKSRYLELGIRALDAFTRNHPKSRGTDRAKYMLATIYVEFGSSGTSIGAQSPVQMLENAVTEYADLSRRYPNSEYAEIAYLDRGDVLLHKLKRPDDALAAYKSGAVNSRRYGDMFGARIGDVYLGLKRYDDAEHYFAGLNSSDVPELIQTGWYYSGLLLAFTGEYQAAIDTLTALAETDPSSRYTNDAIEMSWVLQEAVQFESNSLAPFLAARQVLMIGDTTAAMIHLQTVTKAAVYETLRPRAMYLMGSTLYESGDIRGAVVIMRQFLKEYPGDDLRPDVQRKIGEIYEFGFENYDRALKEYEDVLVTYPDYAFLDEVRKDVRRLRFIVEGEEYEN